MFYKIKNILGVSALAMIVAAASNPLYAQGVVTLSEDAMFDENIEETSSVSVPEGAPLFGTENTDTSSEKMESVSIPVQSTVAEKTSAPIDQQISEPVIEASAPVMPAEMLNKPGAGVGVLGVNDSSIGVDAVGSLTKIDDAVFAKMSDLEKQTALLNLELRREKVKNEIEALKNQRKQAIIQEQEKAEEKERQKLAWEKEQEQKVLQEQQKLRELDIQFEKERQERLLNAYKNEMLAANQEWIAHEGSLYKQIDELKEEKSAIMEDMKNKLTSIKTNVSLASAKSSEMISAYKKEIDNLQTQISVLKARIDAQEREIEKKNPFADGGDAALAAATVAGINDELTVPELKLPNMYAVMEIRGQGGELIAKLINQDGTPFYVKKGTALQSGHIVDEITSTYVRAEKDGIKDYLYFAAGGILPLEQPKSQIKPSLPEGGDQQEAAPAFATSVGIPGLGKSMIAR